MPSVEIHSKYKMVDMRSEAIAIFSDYLYCILSFKGSSGFLSLRLVAVTLIKQMKYHVSLLFYY